MAIDVARFLKAGICLRFRPQGSAGKGFGLSGVMILKGIEVKIDVIDLYG